MEPLKKCWLLTGVKCILDKNIRCVLASDGACFQKGKSGLHHWNEDNEIVKSQEASDHIIAYVTSLTRSCAVLDNWADSCVKIWNAYIQMTLCIRSLNKANFLSRADVTRNRNCAKVLFQN